MGLRLSCFGESSIKIQNMEDNYALIEYVKNWYLFVFYRFSIRTIISDVTINTAKAILTSLILKKLSNFMLAVMLSLAAMLSMTII